MRVPTIIGLLFVFVEIGANHKDEDDISRWAYGLRTLLQDCPESPSRDSDQRDFIQVLRYCLQHRAMVAVDTLLMDDVIPILDGINLVRYEDRQASNTTGKEFHRDRLNDTKDEETSESDKGWPGIVVDRLTRLFRTHVLKIDFDQVSIATGLSRGNFDDSYSDGEGHMQGRRRRHRRKGMMPMLMMGFLFMGTVLIPMGFQFLAVLGGKALILAKMALMLSSIQGLKKIATSGVNYGLYHSPVSDGWHDRSHQDARVPPIELPYQTYSRGQFTP